MSRQPPYRVPAALTLALCLLCSACAVSPLAKHTAAFSTATNLVVDNSTTAYQAVLDIHDEEQVSAGVLKIQQGQLWDPQHDIQPLISPAGLQARLAILAALKAYAQDLSDITSGLNSTALDQATQADGASLKDVGTALATTPGLTSYGISVSPQTANAASTAALALAEVLNRKVIKRDVPPVIKQMDPQIQTLCTLLTDDIDTIRKTSKRDYDQLIIDQTVYVRVSGKQLSAADLHAEVEKIPALIRNQQAADTLLAGLHTAIARLALTHHALAAEAQGNNPEALKARIADLASAGQNLSTYYQGLPTK